MRNTNKTDNKKQQINFPNDISTKSDSVYFENAALFFIIAFLSIDFLPNFGSIEIIGVQYLYLALLNTVIGLWVSG